MTDLVVREYVEVHAPASESRLITDTELAFERPAPHRAPDLVARRAAALALVPHEAPTGRGYPIWPLLIIAGVCAAYLYVGLVVLR